MPTTDMDDKLIQALNDAFEKGWCAAAQWAQRDDLRHDTGSIAYAGQRDAILAGKAAEVRAAIIADLCGDVEPVAEFGGRRQTPEGTTEFWGVLLEPWDAPPKGSHLYSASTVAALKAEQAKDAAEDAELLDWLDTTNKRFKMGWKVGVAPAGNCSVQSVIFLGNSEPVTIRAAIRAARAAERKAP